MKAMILAAGLGTRLKPWTLSHPKALVPVEGTPMLERVINTLKAQGVSHIVVNIHHFGEQIIDFLNVNDFDIPIEISDEREELLDTGGGILHASPLFGQEDVLIHNTDILSNADLKELMATHTATGADITLLTSNRNSSRKLIFDTQQHLKGWINTTTGETRPEGLARNEQDNMRAFSGIYIIGARAISRLKLYAERIKRQAFPIMDFLLDHETLNSELTIMEKECANLQLLDIGKPDTLAKAPELLKSF